MRVCSILANQTSPRKENINTGLDIVLRLETVKHDSPQPVELEVYTVGCRIHLDEAKLGLGGFRSTQTGDNVAQLQATTATVKEGS